MSVGMFLQQLYIYPARSRVKGLSNSFCPSVLCSEPNKQGESGVDSKSP